MNEDLVRRLNIYLAGKCGYHNDYNRCPTCGLLEKEIFSLLETLDLETGLLDTSGNNYSYDRSTNKHTKEDY